MLNAKGLVALTELLLSIYLWQKKFYIALSKKFQLNSTKNGKVIYVCKSVNIFLYTHFLLKSENYHGI